MKKFEGKIQIDTHALEVKMTYDIKNEVTVVFENGYGATYDYWSGIQEQVSKSYNTFCYNRTGIGRSDDVEGSKDSRNQARVLRKLLDEAGVVGPYLIVAHSIGGLNIRAFASEYSKEIAGLLFLDCSHEEQNDLFLANATPEFKEAYISQFTLEGSFDDMLESSEYASQKREALKEIPLTVISATNHGLDKEIEDKWLELQEDMSTMSKYGEFVIAKGCGHGISEEKPQLVIEGIEKLINRL